MIKPRACASWAALVMLTAPVWLLAQTSAHPFAIPSGATDTFISGAMVNPVNTGFATIQADEGRTAPAGFAIFDYRPNGTLVSETTVPTSPLVTSTDRFFVEIGNNVNTGVVISNPNSSAAMVSFGFQDPDVRFRGGEVGTGTLTIPAHSQVARFLNEAPFNRPSPYFGLMHVQSSIPVAVTALRGFINGRSEFLMTNVVQGQPLPGTFGSVPVQPRVIAGYIPRFADGGGWTTQIVLNNTSSSDLSFVTLDFVDSLGAPVAVAINGQTGSSFDFNIDRGDFLRVTTDGTAPGMRDGYVRITAREHSASFNGFALYNLKRANVTVSTSSLPMVQPGASFLIPVQEDNTVPTIHTGIAINNASSAMSSVFLELLDLAGTPTGFMTTVQIPPSGQIGNFLREIPRFEAVPPMFQGVLRVTANSSAGVTAVGVRGRVNERGDFLMSAILPADPTDMSTEKVVPQVVQGGGYSTEIVLFNGQTGTLSTGTVTTTSNSGSTVSLSQIN
jgi:hypothetical protein